MIHEEKKVAKIIEELTVFFFAIGSNNMSSSIERVENDVKITFHSDYNPDDHYSIEKLERCLNEPKNAGMEDIYWELAGTGNPGESSQLLLIGMMVDRCEIKENGNQVTLELYKKLLP